MNGETSRSLDETVTGCTLREDLRVYLLNWKQLLLECVHGLRATQGCVKTDCVHLLPATEPPLKLIYFAIFKSTKQNTKNSGQSSFKAADTDDDS